MRSMLRCSPIIIDCMEWEKSCNNNNNNNMQTNEEKEEWGECLQIQQHQKSNDDSIWIEGVICIGHWIRGINWNSMFNYTSQLYLGYARVFYIVFTLMRGGEECTLDDATKIGRINSNICMHAMQRMGEFDKNNHNNNNNIEWIEMKK